jgi:hypothetical protein
MHELDLTRELSIEVAYVDEHVVELAAVVEAGHWRECATAYTVSAEVAQFAEALLRFADGGPSATFAAGAGTGVGLVALRFYRIGRSVAARMDARRHGRRPPEPTRRLAPAPPKQRDHFPEMMLLVTRHRRCLDCRYPPNTLAPAFPRSGRGTRFVNPDRHLASAGAEPRQNIATQSREQRPPPEIPRTGRAAIPLA